MDKILKGILKVLLIILCIIVIFAGVIFGLRLYNDYKFDSVKSHNDVDVTDMSQYPTKLDGIEVRIVDNGAFQGFHLIPKNKKFKGVIVCYGGSDGSPFFEVAQSYAQKGYETLSIFMFGMKNQPKELTRVPLEQFGDVLDYIDKNIGDKYPITIVGASKGAEYALNLAARYDEISNVILFAPVAYSFSGLNYNAVSSASSWTWQGKEVPYVNIQNASFFALLKDMLFPMMIGAPANFRGLYDAALDADKDKDAKLIPAGNIKGDILAIYGEEDGMMDTAKMASLIKSQHANTKVCGYSNAGHMFSGNGIMTEFGMRMNLGGTVEGNEKAMIESTKEVEKFLKLHHEGYMAQTP